MPWKGVCRIKPYEMDRDRLCIGKGCTLFADGSNGVHNKKVNVRAKG